VGVSAYADRARWSVWEADAVMVPRSYVDSVTAAGGVPLVLPPVPGIEAAVARLDALVVSGGPDIDPARYGADRDAHAQPPVHDRDDAESALIGAAVALGIPVLGICRGMQLLNVVCGGTLVQHLPDVVGHTDHSPAPGGFGAHEVRVEPRSVLATVLGRSGPMTVPTNHHQAVARVGDSLVVTARAVDGTVEGIEDPTLPFCLGVQWHPEAGHDLTIFKALVNAAARPAGARRGTGALASV
jgi:gamma-glutamyl-gamma-aminobutyrate hydrolase PuuD